MNRKIYAWAWSLTGITPYEKLVLLAMVQSYDEATKECCPSKGHLANLTGLSKSGIFKLSKSLEEKEIIYKCRRHDFDGSTLPNAYIFNTQDI